MTDIYKLETGINSNRWCHDICQTCGKYDIIYPTERLGESNIELWKCANCMLKETKKK